MMVVPPARAFPVASRTADLAVIGGRFLLRGWHVRESASSEAAASFYLRDGDTAAAPFVTPLVELAASTSTFQRYDGFGVLCEGGLYLDIVAGEIELAIYGNTETRWLDQLATIEQAILDVPPALVAVVGDTIDRT